MLIKRVWIDSEPEVGFDPKTDTAGVLVEMEDGQLWQAQFVTLAHLQQELALSLEVARGTRALALRQFLAMETSHVIVEELTSEVIEDVVDNLMALGVFESVFNEFSPDTEDAPLPAAVSTTALLYPTMPQKDPQKASVVH